MIGESSVGKTSLITRYFEKKFDKVSSRSSLGLDFASTKYDYLDQEYTMKVWDSAGMERFRTITKNFVRKADAMLIVFDLTERKSFDAIEKWLESVE